MPFPETSRIVFTRNPLDEVICQLRFPQNLRIQTESPAEFQQAISADFPELVVQGEDAPQFAVPPGISVSFQQQKVYRFISRDGGSQLSLSSGFVALSTRRYSSWGAFRTQFEAPLAAVQRLYAPPYVTRVGLRYVDVLRPAALGLSGSVAWGDFVLPALAGEVALPQTASAVVSSLRESLLTLQNCRGHVRIRHGLAYEESEMQQMYLIDSDFFSDGLQLPLNDAWGLLDSFNMKAGNLFRWFITEKTKIKLMEPA